MSINQIESQIGMKDMKTAEVTQIIMKTTGECLSAETIEVGGDTPDWGLIQQGSCNLVAASLRMR